MHHLVAVDNAGGGGRWSQHVGGGWWSRWSPSLPSTMLVVVEVVGIVAVNDAGGGGGGGARHVGGGWW